MELLTGLVAESANSLLKAAIGRIVQEIELAWGFKSDLRDLERQLRRLDSILCGSGQTRSGAGNNPDLDEWLKEIRKVAYQAEDIMDEYSYELLKRKIALRNRRQRLRRVKTKTRFFLSLSSNPVVFRLKMAHRVKSIKESIDIIYDEAKKHEISPVEVAGGKSYVYNCSDDHNVTAMSLQRQMPYNEVLIQRKDAEDDVVRWLREASHSDKHLSVVGIWGMAGLGKTTLCESIFKRMEVDGEFEERIWICVSHDFDFIQLLNRMIEKIEDKRPSNILDLQDLEAKLINIMKGRKFLLVLDDIWDTFEKYWSTLRRCLKDVGASKGNTILATSRVKDTLEKSDPFGILSSEKLSGEDSRSLFEQCVGENNFSDPTKADFGWKMLRKCDGVPLAIKALGGVLRSQNSASQWEKIEQDHNIWNKVDDIIMPSVKLTFKYLQSAVLKKCFAFCAIFKEDEVIEKDRLIQLWMAQGFLQPYDHKKEQLCDELLGEKFLHILLNYSLLQEARFDDLGNVRTCKMHDMVRSLALDISKGDTEITERRSLHLQDRWSLKRAYFNITREGEFIKKTKHLRALSLVNVGLEKLPDCIGELKHLRYLDISRNKIERLPIGLGKLYNLQTLRIVDNFDPVRGFPSMPMFPKEFTQLNNLRHLCTNIEMEIPHGIGMLTSLQTLPAIDLDKHSWGGTASELGNLHNLKGSLQLTGFRDAGIIEELKEMKLGTKEKVEKLDLTFYSPGDLSYQEEDVNHMRMLEALEPHPSLLALEIYRYQSKVLPNWMMEMTGYGGYALDHLVYLYISSCDVLEQLPSMKNLSALKMLKISCCYEAKSLQNLECLTSLQSLDLFMCFKMQNLSDIGSLSCLEVLRIKHCIKMTCLPSGLSNLPSLKTLKIGNLSPDVSFFPFPNLNHLSPLSTSLRELHMLARGMDKVVNLPNQIEHLCQLKYLEIEAFESLTELPEWLGNLTSLETLVLRLLPLVEYLPSQATMKSLSQLMTLRIYQCDRLEQACSPDGSEWIKIQHIRHVGCVYEYDLFTSAVIIAQQIKSETISPSKAAPRLMPPMRNARQPLLPNKIYRNIMSSNDTKRLVNSWY
ncbi:hypothetical protein Cgig2_017848 [Carnegiea gigantea]|uniref:Disease resistance protein n=1 Tax=Carnegiea gigantea TaxID=171969 RepID=A0A9Q1KZN9_9CARY|nr:hypothetical protein Cgig2_017848 [Carnegiea gigantea]